MKRPLLLFGILVIISGALISCNSKQAVEDKMSTTAIADANGVTHLYEIVTVSDKKPEETTLVEIVTNKSGEAVTDKQGNYLTVSNKAPTLLNPKTTTTKASTTALKREDTTAQDDKNSSKKDNNDVSFEVSSNSSDEKDNKTNTSFESSTDESVLSVEEATDKDGWINRWY